MVYAMQVTDKEKRTSKSPYESRLTVTTDYNLEINIPKELHFDLVRHSYPIYFCDL